MAIRLDDGTRLALGGRVLLGGSPFRIVDLGPGRSVEDLLVDEPEPGDADAIARLKALGVLQPEPPAEGPSVGDIDVVIASRDNPAGLRSVLDALDGAGFASVCVVDDGSSPPIDTAGLAGVDCVRIDRSVGAADARNRGAARGSAPLVWFLDDDVVAGPLLEALGPLSRWLALDEVGAVAPRVRTTPGPGRTARYEQDRGALDLGPAAAPVAPASRVPYVPSAVLLVRREAFEAVDGFDSLERGEDVDLVWRLVAAGWIVRHDPSVVVGHPVRPAFGAWVRQRWVYGRSSAELSRLHPDAVQALELDPWSAAVWVSLLAGRRGVVAGLVLWITTTLAFAPRLRGKVDEPWSDAVRLAGGGTLLAGAASASAIRRSWLPLVLAAATGRSWPRRALACALAAPLTEWRWSERELSPLTWLALRIVDDVASCVGLWHGLVTGTGSWRALRVRFQRGDDLFLDLTGSSAPRIRRGR